MKEGARKPIPLNETKGKSREKQGLNTVREKLEKNQAKDGAKEKINPRGYIKCDEKELQDFFLKKESNQPRRKMILAAVS